MDTSQTPTSSWTSERIGLTRFYKRRFPLVFLLTGTYCCLKSSMGILLAEKLNISNMISTELIKSMMDSLRRDVRLYSQNQYLSGEASLDEFMEFNKNYWRGAISDIVKSLKEGKPVLFEGTLSFEGIIDSPYLPSLGRWEICKRFIEDDPTLDHSTLFDKLNPNPHKIPAAQFMSLDWIKLSANEAEIVVVEEFEKAKNSPAIILPIILIMSRKDHDHLIKERLYKEFSSKYDKIEDLTTYIMDRKEHILEKAQSMQEKLIQTSPGIIMPMSLKHYDNNCKKIQEISLEHIQNQFKTYLNSKNLKNG